MYPYFLYKGDGIIWLKISLFHMPDNVHCTRLLNIVVCECCTCTSMVIIWVPSLQVQCILIPLSTFSENLVNSPVHFYYQLFFLFSPCFIEGTGEFIDAWLSLIEKLVNPESVLDSPHAMPAKGTVPGYTPFNPVQFLINTHKVRMTTIMK